MACSKVLLISNIPSHYRDFLFSQIHLYAKFNFDVWYLSKTEPNRSWQYDSSVYPYPSFIYNSFVFRLYHVYVHINLRILIDLYKYKPDILIIGGIGTPLLWLLRYLVPMKTKKILWVESNLDSALFPVDFFRSSFLYNKFCRLKHFLLSFYDYYIVPGIRAVEYLEHFVKPDRISNFIYLPNLIDPLDPFSVGSSLSSASSNVVSVVESCRRKYGKIWLIVARLSPEKGILELTNYLSVLETSNLCILVAGYGPLMETLALCSQTLGINMFLLGNLSVANINYLYKNADLFVLPSLSDSSPLTCVEAIRHGKPLLISSTVGNCPEVLDEGVNGWSFSHNDSASDILQVLDKALQADCPTLSAMGLHSKQVFNSRFSPHVIIPRFVNQLSSILMQSHTP